jgi:hypothetical protein
VSQSSVCEPLAENGGGLNGRFIRRVELIDARLYEALHRAGHGDSVALIGVTKELIEEKRVASGALDAALSESRIRRD